MYEETIRLLFQEAASQIVEGVSPQETLAVSTEFERLLTIRIGKMYLARFPKNDERALRAGRYLTEETCSVPPGNRLEHLRRELLVEVMSDLDSSAWDAAETSLKKSADLPALRAQARAILDRIRELRRVLNEKHPAWEQDYARNLSEASQDCTFVLGESPYSSFRLGRTIRLIQDLGTWPPAWYEELWLENKDNQ